MKKIFILAALLLCASIALASHTSPIVDTVKVDPAGSLVAFTASWGTPTVVYSITTTADTLTAPGPCRYLEIVHGGAATGDTIQVSVAQLAPNGAQWVVKYTESLVIAQEKLYRDFSPGFITRVVVKGSGTIRARVKLISVGR